MGAADDVGALADRLRDVAVADVLPAGHARTLRVSGPLVVCDVLDLSAGRVLAVLRAGDQLIVAPLVTDASTIRRARPGDGVFEGIAATLRIGARGRFESLPLVATPPARGERGFGPDQTNETVVVGERVVVKLMPLTAPGPQPGIDLPAHLLSVGFTHQPTPYGSLAWNEPEGEPVLLASAAAYLPGAPDGWDAAVEQVLEWIDGGSPDHPPLAHAQRMGRSVADLHVALATPSTLLPDPVRPAGRSIVARWHASARRTLDEAVELTDGSAGRRLRSLADRAGAVIDELLSIGRTPEMRVHGDLHVGQVLSWSGGDAIIDFDGNPLAPPEERMGRQSPVRDVASFARSIDHVGRIAGRRRPGREDEIERWIGDARLRFLTEYRTRLRESGRAHLFDARLLDPLEVAQECHEYVYAARYLPRWVSVPDTAMPRLLEAAVPRTRRGAQDGRQDARARKGGE